MSTQPVLTQAQRELLGRLNRPEFTGAFFLTGGTALAECYLHHRLSEDLDFFTQEPGRVPRGIESVRTAAAEMGVPCRVTRTDATFAECFLEHASGPLKVRLAEDAPARLRPVRTDLPLGFPVDHELDIACNKISALFDRAAERDYVDVFFIHRELIPLPDILCALPGKHVGVEPYWLSQAFERVAAVNTLPRMLKPLSLEELKAFFLAEAARLAASFRPPAA